jgi:copper transport protein
VLVALPPGKVALAAQQSRPVATTVTISSATSARVTINPGVHGSVQISVQLSGTVNPLEVGATASLPNRQLGPIPIQLQAAGPRDYTASNVVLPAAGEWLIGLTVRTSDFDSNTATARLHVS